MLIKKIFQPNILADAYTVGMKNEVFRMYENKYTMQLGIKICIVKTSILYIFRKCTLATVHTPSK